MPKLYVILRGEFALYLDPNDNLVHAVAPKMQEHDYRLGTWKDVHTSADVSGTWTLRGADEGGLNPEDETEIFLNVGAPRVPSGLGGWLHLILPKPFAIHAGLTEDTNTLEIIANGTQVSADKIPKKPALVSIFEYAWSDAAIPFLEKTSNTGETGGTNEVVGTKVHAESRPPHTVLHVVASGCWPEEEAHAKDAFRFAAAILGVNAAITWTEVGGETEQPVPGGSNLEWNEINEPWCLRSGMDHPLTREETMAAINDMLLRKKLTEDEKGSGNCGQVIPCKNC